MKNNFSVFADYARYYNLLYQDKDYPGEAAFIAGILREAGSAPKTLLDLGCGTGRHALEMARSGVHVTGVDMSETMLHMGRELFSSLDATDFAAPLPELHQGDARTFRVARQFDAATSLFHVMSYQNSEEDALALLATAHAHLASGGLFFFDFWFGQGVLRDPPARRERIMEDETMRIRRIAVPEQNIRDNLVVVKYTVESTPLPGGASSLLQEQHSMRYWFLPELRYLAGQAGFRVLREGGGLHDAPPAPEDWTAWMLIQKI